MTALRERYPELGRRIESVRVEQENLFLVAAKGRFPVLGIRRNGEEFFLDDSEDPVATGRRMVKGISRETELIVSFGLGFGYHLLPLLNSTYWRWRRMWVIEPQLVFFIIALHYVDLSALIADERVNLIVGEEDENPGRVIDRLAEEFYDHRTDNECTMLVLPPWQVLEHPGSVSFSHQYLKRVWDRFCEVAQVSEKNRRTLEKFSTLWMENILANLPAFLRHEGAGILHGKFVNRPAVIVGAGPSLDKNVHHLRGQEDRVVIIAVDTALKTLLAAGVTPHIVVSIDAGEENVRDFEGIELKESLLAFSPVVNPAIPAKAARRLVLRYNHPLVCWVERLLKLNLGSVVISGSVSTAAFDLAYRMGCRPLVLVGQDMAYAPHGTHTRLAPSAYLHQGLGRFATSESLLRARQDVRDAEWVEDINGERVKSSQAMLGWKRWFEDRIHHLNLEVINCTEGGVGIEGADAVPLEEFLRSLKGSREKLRDRFAAVKDRRPRPPSDLLRRGLKCLADESFAFVNESSDKDLGDLEGRDHLAVATLWERPVLSKDQLLEHTRSLAEAALAARRRL